MLYIKRLYREPFHSLTLVALVLSFGLALLVATPVLAASTNLTVVSDNTTAVVTGNVPGASYPYNAVLAWQPYNPTNNYWDTSITGHVFPGSARWIWESYRVVHPKPGDIVDFKKGFSIPGNPTAGTIYITCDNGYELRVNGTLVGSAQLGANWRTSNLTESFVHTDTWKSVESWNITSYLVRGANHIEIATANEYYGPLDGQSNGTIDINPAGLIFEANITCESLVPTVITGSAILVEETIATLDGTITDDGDEACQYRFEYGTASGNYTANTGWTGSKTTGQSFSANVTGLGKGTKYYFRAQAKNSAGTASGSELSLLTKPDPPVAATFSATVASSTGINLSWTKGEGAQRTKIMRKEGSYPTGIDDGYEVYFDTGTSASDTDLSPATTYYYSAWSEVTGSQQWSAAFTASAATTSEAPPPPTAVGGTVYPVNKAQVLAPWLGLLLVLSLAMSRIVFGLRKRT